MTGFAVDRKRCSGATTKRTFCVRSTLFAGHAECREGHDHLIGMPHTGDFNVAGDVILVAFTPQGFSDGAIRPAS
jgi:hypothetical protein